MYLYSHDFFNVSVISATWLAPWAVCVSISGYPLSPSQGHHAIVSLPLSSVQFSSVAQSCPTLCDSMNHSTPGLPVSHQLLESTQTHVHQVGDAIQPSHPLSSPSPPGIFPSIRVFSNESALHIRWPKYWSFNISPFNEYSGLISFRIDWLDLLSAQHTLVLKIHYECW